MPRGHPGGTRNPAGSPRGRMRCRACAFLACRGPAPGGVRNSNATPVYQGGNSAWDGLASRFRRGLDAWRNMPPPPDHAGPAVAAAGSSCVPAGRWYWEPWPAARRWRHGESARSAGGPALPGRPLAGTARGHFPGQAAHVGKARRFIAGVLGDGWPRLDDVLLLAGEVTSNAVRHTASGDGGRVDVTLAVFAAGGAVRGGGGAPGEGAGGGGSRGGGR